LELTRQRRNLTSAAQLEAAFDGGRVTAVAFGRDGHKVLKSPQLVVRVNGAVYRWYVAPVSSTRHKPV
jgi:hypothetical protein